MKNRVLVFFAQSLGLMDYLSLDEKMMASEEGIQAQQIQTWIYLLQNMVMLLVKILVVLYENRHFTAFSQASFLWTFFSVLFRLNYLLA